MVDNIRFFASLGALLITLACGIAPATAHHPVPATAHAASIEAAAVDAVPAAMRTAPASRPASVGLPCPSRSSPQCPCPAVALATHVADTPDVVDAPCPASVVSVVESTSRYFSRNEPPARSERMGAHGARAPPGSLL